MFYRRMRPLLSNVNRKVLDACQAHRSPHVSFVKPIRFAIAILLSAACANTDVRPPPRVTFAQFDPTASPPVLPTPTDLARDPTTGRITIPLAPNASPAEREFAAYLESLDGFPPSSHATAPFSAPLAQNTLTPNNVIVLDLTAKAPVSGATFTAIGTTLDVIAPGGAWIAGHTYGIGVRGGANGVHAADGQQVVASPTFFFARSTTPIPPMNALLSQPQSVALEQLRLALAPLVDAFTAAGLPRNELAVAWSFTISNRPFGAYDPAASRLP